MKGHYSDVWQAVAASTPDRVAVRAADGRSWTYREFVSDAGALAGFFVSQGLAAGHRVAILLYNRPEFLLTLCATLATGLVPVPLNYRFKAREVADLLVDCDASALVYPSSLSSIVEEAVAAAGMDPVLVVVDDTGDGAPRRGTPWESALGCPHPLPAHAPADGELWLYTGGTTGRPKAVVWGGEDLLEVQLYAIYGPSGLPMPQTMSDVVQIASDPKTPRLVTLPLAPFMHGTALFMSMNTLVLGGAILVTSSARLDAPRAVSFARECGATRIIVAGDAVTIPLVEAIEDAGLQRLGDVTSVISSGMRLSDDTKRRLHALGDITVTDMLASTEGGAFAVTVTTGIDDLPGRLRLLPSAAVLDDDHREVQNIIGARGILAMRGALPKGYHGDEAKTAATFPVINGVRHVIPGDVVLVLDDHHIELLGRGSAVINTGGEKVYPAEVEEALLQHHAVRDAVVFGVADPRFGEVVAAVLEGDVLVDEVLAAVESRLAGYKKPRHLLVVASLERSPHGKVNLSALRKAVGESIGVKEQLQ